MPDRQALMGFLRRLFCCHEWKEATQERRYPAWWEVEWHCQKCGKAIKLDRGHITLSYVELDRLQRPLAYQEIMETILPLWSREVRYCQSACCKNPGG